MNRHRSFCLCLCLLLPFALAFAPHDDKNNPKSIGNSTPPGIGGDGPWERLNMELLSRLPLDEIGGGQANVLGSDCWGWTDPENGTEYAICGLTNGTSFIDISDPTDPKYLGKLMTQTGNAAWRDMKVYENHVFIVSDGNGNHGMQVFDLTQLRKADRNNPVTFSNTAWYDGGTNSAHNIAINEDTGFAYIVGSDHPDAAGGLQVVDISDPAAPVHAGVYSGDGYTHDVQVVSYQGPDRDYESAEIAFASNEDTVTIVDVTNKGNMTLVSRNPYSATGYTHQGWLSDDHRFFYMGDELDESSQGGPTRTHIFDCTDLDNPVYMGYYSGQTNSIDHNLYVKGNLMYCGNYSSGLRVLEIGANPAELTEIAFFDSYNTDTGVNFNGTWSVYPYYDSGTVLINDRQNGMFLVKLSPISVSLPQGVPDLVHPDGDVEFTVQVDGFYGTAQSGTGVLHVDLGTGNGFETWPMNELSSGIYEADFPASECGSDVTFYVSAQATDGTVVCNPPNAPLDFYTAMSADSFEIIYLDDMESDLGWSVSGDASDGQWERGVPAGAGDRGDPTVDGDGSGSCFLT
ncbi:MAG: choice-of-anchor B family protein, partial [Pirellulaceae bacterium]